MSQKSNFLSAGSSRKVPPTAVKKKKVVSKKMDTRSKSSLVKPSGSGGNAANPGDANVRGHSCEQS